MHLVCFNHIRKVWAGPLSHMKGHLRCTSGAELLLRMLLGLLACKSAVKGPTVSKRTPKGVPDSSQNMQNSPMGPQMYPGVPWAASRISTPDAFGTLGPHCVVKFTLVVPCENRTVDTIQNSKHTVSIC